MTEESNVTPQQLEAQAPVAENTVSFMDSIAEEFRPLAESKGFKSTDDALKSYANLEKMVGNSIRLPNEDSSPEMRSEFYSKLAGIEGVVKLPGEGEDKSEFYNKLGRPEEATGYELGEAENIFIGEEAAKFKSLAHELGLSNEQAAKLTEFQASFVPTEEQIQQEQEAYQAKAKETLEEAWGKDYDNRVQASLDVLNKYEGKHAESIAELKEVAGNNPGLRIILADLAESLQEKGSLDANTRVGMSADGARDRISQLRADTGFMEAYMDSMHPGHAKAKETMNDLYQKAK